MAKKNVTPVSVFVPDFSSVATSVAIPPKPSDNVSADKADAMKQARNQAYERRAALEIDAACDMLDSLLSGTSENVRNDVKRVFVTFIAQCTKANYSIADVAMRHALVSPVVTAKRDETRLSRVQKDLAGMKPADIAALIATLQAQTK